MTVLAGCLALSPALMAQRGAAPRGFGAPGARDAGPEQLAAEAADKVELAAKEILNNNLTQLVPLRPREITVIRTLLNEQKRYAGMFPQEKKAYLLMLEALLAHYAGDGKQALADADRAYRTDADNPDTSDLNLVMALYYEEYDLARKILHEREAGSQVLVAGPLQIRPGRDPAEPNLPARLRNPLAEPNAPMRNRPGGSAVAPPAASKWERLLGSPETEPTPRTPVTGRPLAGDAPPAGRIASARTARTGTARIGMVGTERKSYDTILNLPVDYMPYEMLGENFGDVNLHSINGSFFPFASGKGRILCALLWSRRATDGPAPVARSVGTMRDYDRYESYGGRMNPRQPAAGEAARTIPPVSSELETNIDQFRSLFVQYIAGRKVGFVGVNFDRDAARTQQGLFAQPQPWATCLAGDPVNQAQWNLPTVAGALLLLVDTKGQVRYLGPVGGFLPLLLLEKELELARPTMMAGMPTPAHLPAAVPMDAAGRSGPAGQKRSGVMGLLFGGPGEGKAAADLNPPDSAPAAGAAAGGSTAVGAQAAASTGGGTTGQADSGVELSSNMQARQILRTAQVQRKLTPRSAVNACDEVIRNWPDSQEAQEAKLMIRSLMRDPRLRQMKEERIQQGKYVGED
ncbi:MAG: hypothetical protein JW810_05715 [Sedimentisphaerales bacterium]|nr:hypothetical protein [Sedimentisphaerales bacterium]